MSPNLSSELIRQIQTIAQSDPQIEQIILYGSRARGTANERSDIDLAIKGDLSPAQLGRLREQLEALPILQRFDLLLLDDITDQSLTEAIAQEGVMIYPAAQP